MLESYFIKPGTVDRVRCSWIAPEIERYVDWLGECRRNRVSVIERTGHAIYIHSSRSDFLFERGAERARRASAGVPGTDVEIGGVNPVVEP